MAEPNGNAEWRGVSHRWPQMGTDPGALPARRDRLGQVWVVEGAVECGMDAGECGERNSGAPGQSCGMAGTGGG